MSDNPNAMSDNPVKQRVKPAREKPKGDPILRIMELYRNDARPHKIDLSVGVYKDEAGNTPVLPSVKTAERRLFEQQESKSYVGLAGNAQFSAALGSQIFDQSKLNSSRLAAIQSVGGSGGLRLGFEYALQCEGVKRLLVSTPTWENQAGIAGATGLEVARYPYYDRDSGQALTEQMMAALAGCGPQDAVMLHGCCHNPSGSDLSVQQWEQIADSAATHGWLPMIDLAYAGFGGPIDQDTAGLNALIARVPTTVVAVSCSKIFGLYRERVGAVYIATDSADSADLAAAEMMRIAREIYSMPPDHGAAVVQTILHDDELRAQWLNELADMRDRINGVRSVLSNEMNRLDGSDRFSHLASQNGMFSLLPLSVEQVHQLRDEHAVYVIEDGRTNVAGVTEANAAQVAKAIMAVL